MAKKAKKKAKAKKKVASKRVAARKKPATTRAAAKKPANKRTAAKKAVKKKVASRTATKRAATKRSAKKAATKTARKSVKGGTKARTRTKSKVTKKEVPKPIRRKPARRSATKARPAKPTIVDTGASLPIVAVTPGTPVTGSSNLRKRDLDQFRELLLAKRGELVGDVATLQSEALSQNRQDAAGDLSSMPIHMADLGTDNYEKEFTLGLIEGERALLRDIDEALTRIKDGTYGVCQATGRPIGKARLKARPWAKYCYEYVLAQEKGQSSEGF